LHSPSAVADLLVNFGTQIISGTAEARVHR